VTAKIIQLTAYHQDEWLTVNAVHERIGLVSWKWVSRLTLELSHAICARSFSQLQALALVQMCKLEPSSSPVTPILATRTCSHTSSRCPCRQIQRLTSVLLTADCEVQILTRAAARACSHTSSRCPCRRPSKHVRVYISTKRHSHPLSHFRLRECANLVFQPLLPSQLKGQGAFDE
jgi:hypothetical protein